MKFDQLKALVDNSGTTKLRDAIIADVRTVFPYIKTVEPYGGQFSGEGLKRVSASQHAVYVSIMGVPNSATSGHGKLSLAVTVSLFVLATNVKDVPRDDAALAIAEACAGMAHMRRWNNWIGPLSFAQSVKIARVNSQALDVKGVSLVAVSWSQNIEIGADHFARPEGWPETMGAAGGAAVVGNAMLDGEPTDG